MKKISGIWVVVDRQGNIILITRHHQLAVYEEEKMSSVKREMCPYSIIPLEGQMEKKFVIQHKPCRPTDEYGHRWAKWININEHPWKDFFMKEVRTEKSWARRMFSSETHDVIRVTTTDMNWYRICHFCGKKEFRLEI